MLVRIKSHTESKFSRTTLWQLFTRGTVVVQSYYDFFPAASDGATAERPIQNRFLVNFAAFCGGYVRHCNAIVQ